MSDSQDWRARKWEDTHRRIYDTALRLFQEHGFEQVSVGQIAAGAGVSVPTFYAHYPSKEHIVMQLPTAHDFAALLADQPADLPLTERIRRAVPLWLSAVDAGVPRGRAGPLADHRGDAGPAHPGRRVRARHRRAWSPTRSPTEPGDGAAAGGRDRRQRLHVRVHGRPAGLGRLQRRAQARGAHRGGVRRAAASSLTGGVTRGDRSSTTVTSGRAPTRIGGPQ